MSLDYGQQIEQFSWKKILHLNIVEYYFIP